MPKHGPSTNAEAVQKGWAIDSWWVRVEHEVEACPACASSRIALLDALSVGREISRRGVAFVTGCRECGLLFINPLPTPEQVAAFYASTGPWSDERRMRAERIATVYARRMKRKTALRKPLSQRRRSEQLLSAIQPHFEIEVRPAGRKALDFGCGDGKFLDSLQARGWDTYGIEPSSDLPFALHQRLMTVPADASFDLVILHHVLEHVLDPLQLLRRLASALRVGGALFVSVPRLDRLPEHGDFSYCINARTHFVSFSETCLRGLLARAGFATVARLDDPVLDRQFSRGLPLRLRLLARRTLSPPPLPVAPLRAAQQVLVDYGRSAFSAAERRKQLLPVRLRAALLERVR